MSYPGHRPIPPRSILVIVGGMIAWAGMVGGVLITTPDFHRALTMKPVPVEMSWQKLVEQGLTDNSYVRLIGVDLEQNDSLRGFEDMFAQFEQFDPEAPAEEQQAAFEQMAIDNFNFMDFAEAAMEPMKVVPVGVDPDAIPAKVVVPISGWAVEAAMREIEQSGTLTGRFTLAENESLEMQLTRVLMRSSAAAAEQAMQEAGVPPQDEADAQQEIQNEKDNGPRWVYEPVESVPNLSESQQWFWLSGLAVAIGMVICGAGGPSISCCIFFQGPSILSLFGYPLRYGRGGKTARLVYCAIGIGLLVYGYQTMITEGKFGQLDGDIALGSFGFLVGSIGAAALLGAGTNALTLRLNISLDPKTTKKVEAPKISLSEACSMEPTDTDLTAHFVDQPLARDSDLPMTDELISLSQTLTGIGFGAPEPLAWLDGEQTTPTLIQSGCQEMVVADTQQIDGQLSVRMVSVLHDGLAIVTLSPDFQSSKNLRFGSSGLYLISPSVDPMEMLSAHLEQTVSMAEKRDTSVVTIDATEVGDVVQFGRRALADIRAQYGEELIEVGDASYGRFRFPVTEVPSL